MGARGIIIIACLAIFLVALPVALSSPAGDSGCTPGESWQADCNTCTCTPTGIAACTRKACLKLPTP